MHIGAVDDCLPQFLNVPGSNWLRVGQFRGKHLKTRSRYKNSGWAEKGYVDPRCDSTSCVTFPRGCGGSVLAKKVSGEENSILPIFPTGQVSYSRPQGNRDRASLPSSLSEENDLSIAIYTRIF